MRKSLGKGLQSLIPKKESKIRSLIKDPEIPKRSETRKESVFNVEIDKIRPNPDQPRRDIQEESLKELASSITEHGILQPLLVTKIERPTDRGQQVEYELVAGERRWRAARMAGLPHVPVIIRDNAAQKKLELALVENIQRENLNPIEAALAFRQLQEDFGLKHNQIAEKIGKKRTTISNTLRLLALPPQVQQAVVRGQLTEGHARAILLAKSEAQMPIFRKVLNGNYNVRQVEDMARKMAPEYKSKATGPKNILFKKLEKQIQEKIGQRVSITKRGELGHLRIEFATQKELDQLVDHLLKY